LDIYLIYVDLQDSLFLTKKTYLNVGCLNIRIEIICKKVTPTYSNNALTFL
jgi:hypothetical protein